MPSFYRVMAHLSMPSFYRIMAHLMPSSYIVMVRLSMPSFYRIMAHLNMPSFYILMVHLSMASFYILMVHLSMASFHRAMVHLNMTSFQPQHALLLQSNSAFHSFLCYIRFSRLCFFAQFVHVDHFVFSLTSFLLNLLLATESKAAVWRGVSKTKQTIFTMPQSLVSKPHHLFPSVYT